jgi:TetR/AcrR family transcriptional repressor of mexJK operon
LASLAKADKVETDLDGTISDRILNAALEVFMEEGFSGATTDMIQVRSGIAKSTIYRHFPSKESLFIAAFGNGATEFLRTLEKLDLNYTDIEAFLRRFGAAYLDKILAKRGLNTFRLMAAEGQRFPHLGRIFYRTGPRRLIEFVEVHLAHAHSRGELSVPDPQSAAEYFTSMISIDFQLRGMLGTKLPSKRERALHVDRTVTTFMSFYRAANS